MARPRRYARAAPLTPQQRLSEPPGGAERLLTADEVAKWLLVTTAWVYAETRAGRMPHVRIGRYYRYWPSSIDAWLHEQERR